MGDALLVGRIKAFAEESLREFRFKARPEAPGLPPPPDRAPRVYAMRLPDKGGGLGGQFAPYAIVQLIAGRDSQQPGSAAEGQASVRIIACAYDRDGEAGSLALLNMLGKLRADLLGKRVIAGKHELILPLERIFYPDDTGDYYLGELMAAFSVPCAEREDWTAWA